MTKTELPPLPEARKPDEHGAGWFTAGQMRAHAAQEVAAELDRCIAALRALKDDSGVNDDGQAWLRRLTRGDCVAALLALKA